MLDEFTHLEQLAKKASKGAWYAAGAWVETDNDKELDPCNCDLSSFGQRFEEEDIEHYRAVCANSNYIAAAQPATVLQLIKEIRRLRKG